MKKIFLILLAVLIGGLFIVNAQYGDDDAFQDFLKNESEAFGKYVEDDEEAFEKYKEEIREKWNEFVSSTKKEWVDYSSDLNSKSYVNFEEGYIVVEAIAELDDETEKSKEKAKKEAVKNLEKKIETMFTDENAADDNVLKDQVKIEETKKPVTKKNVKKFVEKEIKPKVKVEDPEMKSKDGKKRVKVQVKIQMVPDHLKIRAEKYLGDVKKYAKRYDLEVPLVLAVIQTESYYNPLAKSHIPAYGLMQIVPTSAGRDTHKRLFGVDKVMKPSELYDPVNNIKHGTTYLDILYKFFRNRIQDPEKKEYAVICSYNGGMGTVNNIIKKRDIEKMSDKEFYDFLKAELLAKSRHYKETADYLDRVTTRKENYLAWK